jgi:hypothetical protein
MDPLTMFVAENLRMPEEINRPELNDPAAAAYPAGVGLPNGPGAAQQGLAA